MRSRPKSGPVRNAARSFPTTRRRARRDHRRSTRRPRCRSCFRRALSGGRSRPFLPPPAGSHAAARARGEGRTRDAPRRPGRPRHLPAEFEPRADQAADRSGRDARSGKASTHGAYAATFACSVGDARPAWVRISRACAASSFEPCAMTRYFPALRVRDHRCFHGQRRSASTAASSSPKPRARMRRAMTCARSSSPEVNADMQATKRSRSPESTSRVCSTTPSV